MTCEHCGAPLTEGAIFCGECGRAVTPSARHHAPAPADTERPAPPPLQPPEPIERPDPATDAWLPETTLDPATRAWLAGETDDPDDQSDAASGSSAPEHGFPPRAAPSHVHGSESGLAAGPVADDESASAPDAQQELAQPATPQVPVVRPVPVAAPQSPPAPPSWWIGTSRSDEGDAEQEGSGDSGADSAVQTSSTDPDAVGAGAGLSPVSSGEDAAGAAEAGTPASRTQDAAGVSQEPPAAHAANNDTAAFIMPRQAAAPVPAPPLIEPGSKAALCPSCGSELEPDDIFCNVCGAVRPSVTAAYTGPIVPLPTDRPDWSASLATTPDDAPGGDAAAEDGAPHASVDVSESQAEGAESRPDTVRPQPVPEGVSDAAHVPDSDDSIQSEAVEAEVVQDAADANANDGSVQGVQEALGEAAPADGQAEDLEATRIVEPAESTAQFTLHFSTGERAAIAGSALLGRFPRSGPGEQFDALVTIVDPGKSVSKTHLELGCDSDGLWVSDRFSGNGTIVRHVDGSIRECEPGRRYRVERGARVDIGEQFFLVQ